MFLRKIIKKIIDPIHYNNDSYIKYLRKKGISIGENTYFFAPKSNIIDVQNGIFIEIGKNCKITYGCIILAHDYSYSVFRSVYHDIPKKASKTRIGNNVFIGMNSIILSGSEIGDNSVIGAGSVVSGKIPPNEVWGGNPAHFICTLDDYHKKCVNNYENGAFITIDRYKKIYNRFPSIQELQYFSLLFYDGEDIYDELCKMSFNGDNKREVLEDLKKVNKKYKSIEAFYKEKNKE